MAIESLEYPEFIRIEKFCLVENIQDHLLFIDKTKDRMFYFSEKLKKEIQDAGCTGIEFVPAEGA